MKKFRKMTIITILALMLASIITACTETPTVEPTPDPEPTVSVTIPADPEPVVAEPEPVVAEPEPIVAEPEPVVAEPEPTQEPEVQEPEPTAEPEPAQEPEVKPQTQPSEGAVPTSISASLKSGTRYEGDTLTAADFNVTVTYSDGFKDSHPQGWNATPLTLVAGTNTITVTFQGVSTSFTVNAQAKVAPQEPQVQQPDPTVGEPPQQPSGGWPASAYSTGYQAQQDLYNYAIARGWTLEGYEDVLNGGTNYYVVKGNLAIEYNAVSNLLWCGTSTEPTVLELPCLNLVSAYQFIDSH